MSDLNLKRVVSHGNISQAVEGHSEARAVEHSLVQSFKRVKSDDGIILVPMPRSDLLQNVHLAADYTARHPEEGGLMIQLLPGLVKARILDYVDARDLSSLIFVSKNLFTPQQIIPKRAKGFMQDILNAMQARGHERTIKDIKRVFSAPHFSSAIDFHRYVLNSEFFFKKLSENSRQLVELCPVKDSESLISRETLAYHLIAMKMHKVIYDQVPDPQGILVTIFHELEMIVKMIQQVDQENPEPILELTGQPLIQTRGCIYVTKYPKTQMVAFSFEDSDAPFLPIELFKKSERAFLLFAPHGLTKIPLEILTCVNLHTLILLGCTYLEALPPEIGRLQNLKNLTLPIASNPTTKPRLKILPDEITQLKNLKDITFNRDHNEVSSLECYERHTCPEDTCTYFFQDFPPVQQRWLQELQEQGCELEQLHVPEIELEVEEGAPI